VGDILIFLAIAILIIIAIFIFLLSTIRFTITYKDKIFKITIGGKYTYITLYNSAKSDKNKKDKKEENKDFIKIPTFDALRKKFSAIKGIYNEEKDEIISILKALNANVQVEKLNFAVTYGFGDAAVTGIANGVIWGGISAASGILFRYFNIKEKTNIAVFPHYTEKCFNIESTFIFDTKLYKSFKIYKRIKLLIQRNKMKFNN